MPTPEQKQRGYAAGERNATITTLIPSPEELAAAEPGVELLRTPGGVAFVRTPEERFVNLTCTPEDAPTHAATHSGKEQPGLRKCHPQGQPAGGKSSGLRAIETPLAARAFQADGFRAIPMYMTAVNDNGPKVRLDLRSTPRGPSPVMAPGNSPAPSFAVRSSLGLMNMLGSCVPRGNNRSKSSAMVIAAMRASRLRLIVSNRNNPPGRNVRFNSTNTPFKSATCSRVRTH